MIDLLLSRISTGIDGTFGVLSWHGKPIAVTLENEWKANARFTSCIPAGTYLCVHHSSPTHGRTFAVREVQGRTGIIFHKGNTKADTQGCILVGEKYGYLKNSPAIIASRAGFTSFIKTVKNNDRFNLAIRDYFA